MTPWRDEGKGSKDDLEIEASRLLARSAEAPTWSTAEKRAVWERLNAGRRAESAAGPKAWWRAFLRRTGWQLPLALAGSIALLIFAVLHAPSQSASSIRSNAVLAAAATTRDWTPVDLGRIGKLRVQAGATYRLPVAAHSGEYRIALDDGTLCAEIAHRDLPAEEPLMVETPQMQVVVVGTRFCVQSHGGISTVAVTEGRVRVHTASGSAFVGAGETLGSHDLRLNASAVASPTPLERLESLGAPQTPSSDARPSRPPGQLVAREWPTVPPALRAAIPKSSLAEQNALYAQGTQARERHDGPAALTAWRSYLARFPQGVLAPDASAGVLGELLTEGRDVEALIAADDYLRSFPADGRAAEVAFIRGNLLHDKQGRIADALSAYRQALALATRPGLRDDALFAVGVCERMLGHTAKAQETFRQYQTEFPNGAHSAELSRWLSQ